MSTLRLISRERRDYSVHSYYDHVRLGRIVVHAFRCEPNVLRFEVMSRFKGPPTAMADASIEMPAEPLSKNRGTKSRTTGKKRRRA